MRHHWVDRIIELQPGVRAVGVKAVALSEDCFTEHFPGNPVLPGIYIIEGLAQTAGALLTCSTSNTRVALMVAVDRARFTAFARPGDLLHLEVSIEQLDGDTARVLGRVRCGDQAVASARILFRLLEPDALIPPAYQPAWLQALAVLRGQFPNQRGNRVHEEAT